MLPVITAPAQTSKDRAGRIACREVGPEGPVLKPGFLPASSLLLPQGPLLLKSCSPLSQIKDRYNGFSVQLQAQIPIAEEQGVNEKWNCKKDMDKGFHFIDKEMNIQKDSYLQNFPLTLPQC